LKQKKADEDIRKAKQENFLLGIQDENQRAIKKAEIDLANKKLEIDALNITEAQKRQLKLQAEIQTGYEIADVNAKIKKEQEEER
jgi:tRNA U34 2-thiouridine synthase MnmA/TrmU